jgi:hypothetical protein
MNKDTSPSISPTSSHNGMTLLQYYAGQAMMKYQTSYLDDSLDVARKAFNDAESMMTEYNKRYGGKNEP